MSSEWYLLVVAIIWLDTTLGLVWCYKKCLYYYYHRYYNDLVSTAGFMLVAQWSLAKQEQVIDIVFYKVACMQVSVNAVVNVGKVVKSWSPFVSKF
jgi:hypothetical protein